MSWSNTKPKFRRDIRLEGVVCFNTNNIKHVFYPATMEFWQQNCSNMGGFDLAIPWLEVTYLLILQKGVQQPQSDDFELPSEKCISMYIQIGLCNRQTCVHIYIYIYICIYICMYVCMDGWMYVCMYVDITSLCMRSLPFYTYILSTILGWLV